MANMTLGRTRVAAPDVVPARGGLFDAATVLDISNPHELMGVEYESDACVPVNLIDNELATCLATAAKVMDEFGFEQSADPIHVYAGVGCSPFGHEQFLPKARARLELGEEYAVESVLWDAILPERAVDITPAGGAVSPKLALGLLSQYAGTQYRGVPTVHAGKLLSVFLAGEQLVKFDEGKAQAVGGSVLSNGAGYTGITGPGGTLAAEGEVWMYISGTVVLRRGEITANTAIAPETNDYIALAERTYVTTVDCFVGAILVNLE